MTGWLKIYRVKKRSNCGFKLCGSPTRAGRARSTSLDVSPAAPCLSKSLIFPASKQFPHCDELVPEHRRVSCCLQTRGRRNSLRFLVTALANAHQAWFFRLKTRRCSPCMRDESRLCPRLLRLGDLIQLHAPRPERLLQCRLRVAAHIKSSAVNCIGNEFNHYPDL